ncbi:hypothetical protein QO010_004606 [Caulobacter ginsengisoli]|uniref:DUF4440 domain-containing protein n=1 Tax=Caulobacter ginsengisoli TaxID=400775 RepID=A0ABU0IXT2_9CAUL|nr:hypothetical protein [Caulobacter ginsengisoli]MDQ0466810.1 hypothetical protein [Caulobacter ginsengisoli]
MKKAILALAAASLANTGGQALAAPSPEAVSFQNEVCSVLAEPPRWNMTRDEASWKRASELSMSYERGWREVRLGWPAGRSSCRKRGGGVQYLSVTADRGFARLGRWTDYGAIDCYYERTEGRWRQIACLDIVITVN